MKIIHLGYIVFLTKNSHIIAMYTDDDIMYIVRGQSVKAFIKKFKPNYKIAIDTF